MNALTAAPDLAPALDPALAWLARGGLALLFAGAALHKWRAPAAFREALGAYRVLPEALVAAAARLVALAETLAALLLLVAPGDPRAPLLALALLGAYSLAIGVNLARGRRELDCGCLGPARRQPIAGWMLARNAALALPALLLLGAPPGPRALSWIDGVSIAGALAIAALCWSASHRLASTPAARRSTPPRPALAASAAEISA